MGLKIKANIFISLVLVSFYGCQNEHSGVNLSSIKQETRFNQFEKDFFETDTNNFSQELNSLKEKYPVFFMQNALDNFWKQQRTDPGQIELYQKSQEVFNGLQRQNEQLNLAVKHFYYYFGEDKHFHFYSYISNLDFNYPVLLADSLCFAALDLYLGRNQKYYAHLPQYLIFYRQPRFLVRDCIEELIKNRISPPKTPGSLLDDMIYHGKILYALYSLMPEEKESSIIKYPEAKLEFCRQNERSVWAYFIENQMLFDTSQELKRRFIELAPFSKFRMKFDNETPGMIGRWVGWQIVKAYMEKNKPISLEQLLQEQDARKILKLSGYRP